VFGLSEKGVVGCQKFVAV